MIVNHKLKKEDVQDIHAHLQAHLAAIVKSSEDAIISKSIEGIIIYWNVGAERIFGYSSDEVLGKSINILAPHKTDEHKEIIEKYNKGEKLEHYETKRVKKDGSTIDVSLTVSPILDENGDTIGFSTIARDVTKRTQYSQYARSLIEASLDPLVTISAEGKITDVNEASIKVTGVPREKLIGTDFSNYFTQPEKAQEGYRQVFEKGFVSDFPLTIRHTDGKLTDVLYNASVYKDNQGNVLGVFAAARDITERKKSEDKFKGLLESAPDAIVIVNNQGIIQLVNAQTEKLFGYKREEIIGEKVEILIPQRFKEIHPSHRKGFFIDPKPRNMGAGLNLFGLNKAGKEFPVEISLSPLETEEGLLVSASIRDITEQKQASQYARSLIEASLDPLVTINADGKITDVNEASVKVTGMSRDKLIGTDFSNYFTEPDKAREGYLQVFEKGFVADYPLTIRHSSGKLTDVLYNASVYKDDKGNVIGVFAAARDVTVQKQASKYARSLIEASLDPLVTISADGKITDVNEASVKVTGMSRDKLIGTDFSNYFTEPDKAREGYLQVFKKGFVADYPLTIRHSSGKLTDVLYNASVYKDDKGNVLGVFAAARDVTEQKQASKYARSLIEASLDPLVTISADGKITDVNEASVKVTGISRDKLIGTDFSNYFTEPTKAQEGYLQVFEKGFVADYPLTIKHKSGKFTDVLYNASVYKDDKGNVLGVFAAARDVTEQKQASKYARSLIEASLDPLVTISADGKITDVNEASVKVTGISRDKLIGTDFSNYFTEPTKAQEGYLQVFEKGFVADYPLTIKHKSGKFTDVLYNASVYKDDKGSVLGVFAAARDITKQKEIEKQIQKIQTYTRTLIETSLDPQITKGPDGLITDVNEATILVTGVPREKIIGTHFPNYFTEPKNAEKAYQEAFLKGFVKNVPLAIKHVSGKITDVLYNATVYKDELGNIQGVFASARDITDRIKAEEESKKSQAYTRSLIEASLDPLVTISADGKITDVNEASVKVTGVSRENLIGADFTNYFTEPTKAQEGYLQVFEKGFVADYPLTIRHSNGKLTDVLYNASVYKDDKGNVLGVFAAARDVTAQKQLAEREIAEREKELMRIEELERFRKLTVGRELKMIELKKEIEELKNKNGGRN